MSGSHLIEVISNEVDSDKYSLSFILFIDNV